MKNDISITFDNIVGFPVDISIKQDLIISKDLDKEVKEAAARFGYYAVLAEKAEAKYEMYLTRYDVWKSKTIKELKETYGKYNKVADMNIDLQANPKYQNWQDALVKAKEKSRTLKQIAKAFELKKDLIQTMCADRRKENYDG